MAQIRLWIERCKQLAVDAAEEVVPILDSKYRAAELLLPTHSMRERQELGTIFIEVACSAAVKFAVELCQDVSPKMEEAMLACVQKKFRAIRGFQAGKAVEKAPLKLDKLELIT